MIIVNMFDSNKFKNLKNFEKIIFLSNFANNKDSNWIFIEFECDYINDVILEFFQYWSTVKVWTNLYVQSNIKIFSLAIFSFQ